MIIIIVILVIIMINNATTATTVIIILIIKITISTVASHPFLGFRLTRELENFLRYHVLGPHLGHTARVDVDFRSGAHLFYGVMS